MLTRFVAKMGIITAQIAVMFLNYWFTFGLWPKSWAWFFGCALLSVGLLGLTLSVDAETR